MRGGGAQISMDWEMSSVNVLDWKLADVPELGYFTSDRPFPRGELLVKTRTMMKGYYKHPKARRLGEPDADRVARLPQWWQGDRGTERTGLASAVLAPGSGEPGCCGSAASPLRTRVSCSGRARARARAAPLMGPQR